MLIERFEYRLPGFNLRPFTLPDLYDLCDELEVSVRRIPMQYLHGCSFVEGGEVFLYINSLLRGPEQVIAGFHEYCHITDHCFDVEAFESTGGLWNLNKRERQAQTVGVVALMPHPLVEGMTVNDLMREFGVSRQVAEFRAALRV